MGKDKPTKKTSTKLDLKTIFGRMSRTMSSEYNLTGLGLHRGLKGTKREIIIKDFLRDNLPQQYGISDGEIFDSKNNISKQNDIIIRNNSMPVFKYGKYLLFHPIESVFGICEVKTRLNKARLKEAIENIQSVKKMILPKPSMFSGTFHDRAYGAVFAFESSKPQTILENMDEIYSELDVPLNERIDMIFVLDKFIILEKSRDKDNKLVNRPLWFKTGKESLVHFIPFMMNGFNKPLSQVFDYYAYLSKSKYETYYWDRSKSPVPSPKKDEKEGA